MLPGSDPAFDNGCAEGGWMSAAVVSLLPEPLHGCRLPLHEAASTAFRTWSNRQQGCSFQRRLRTDEFWQIGLREAHSSTTSSADPQVCPLAMLLIVSSSLAFGWAFMQGRSGLPACPPLRQTGSDPLSDAPHTMYTMSNVWKAVIVTNTMRVAFWQSELM